MSRRKREREFTVYINEDEMERIQEWVKLKPDIETGGDLFGLWIDRHTAVVQFVLGPGKNCRRTYSSFFQDVSYLKNAGSYLTEKNGLCNIGQWHSHHTIPLFQPSGGDNNTVWSNMPTLGMERYIVFIANIKPHDLTKKPSGVTVNCFLYEINDGKQLPVIHGSFEKISGASPFRLNNDVMDIVRIEAESLIEIEKVKEVEQVSELSEESVGRNEGTETTPLPKEDQGNPEENSMPMRSTQSTDDKAVSVSYKITLEVAAGTTSFKDEGIVYNSQVDGTKKSSNKIVIKSTFNKVTTSLVDNKTNTKTEIPTVNDSNRDSGNNGRDNEKSEENKNSKENKMGEGKKNDNTSNTSPNVSTINVNPDTITLTPTPSQSNEQHSNYSPQQNATIEQQPSTNESDNVNPNDNDKEEPTPECSIALTTQPQSNGHFQISTSSQHSNPNKRSCCFRVCSSFLCGL